MSESFAELFEASLSEIDMNPGAIVAGTVIDIDSDWVTVHAGLKSEGVIAKSEFLDEQGNFALEIGHIVKVALETVEDGFGATKLSREKAKRAESWMELEAAYEKNDIVTGVINGKVKGGFTVDLNNIRAFLPGSLVDVRPVRDTLHLEGQQLEFRLIKLDQKRNNVVVSVVQYSSLLAQKSVMPYSLSYKKAWLLKVSLRTSLTMARSSISAV